MLRNRLFFSVCVSGAMLASGWTGAVIEPGHGSRARAQAPTKALRAPHANASAQPVNLLAPLPPELETLKIKVRRALAMYHAPRLNTRDHNTWELMHAIIAYGINSEVRTNGPTGPVLNSIGCLCFNYPCKGQQLFEVVQGRVEAKKGVGVQGHPGQFLAIVAQSHLKTDYPMLVDGRHFTVADLIESEKLGCQTGTELTFKLISLSHYLDPSEKWTNAAGEDWSISRLIHEEIKSPINGAACGGTHRLMGLSYAVRKRSQHDQPIDGEFRRAKIYTDDFHRYTLGQQNSDGSFSTEWFVSPGARQDLARRLQTSGHILEWLAFSLPEKELREPRMIKAASYLSGILLASSPESWEIGPLGHAIHALALYDERLFKAHELAAEAPLAETETPRQSAPEIVADKPRPEVLVDEPEPKAVVAEPERKMVADEPAAQTAPHTPGRLPAVEEPKNTVELTRPQLSPVAETEAAPPAPLVNPWGPDAPTPAPLADIPTEQPAPMSLGEPTPSPNARRSLLAPERAPAWRR